MQEFHNRVAVITGAASGIGLALARRCAKEGMKIVLADIETAALKQAEAQLQADGATTLAVHTDVANANDVKALADKTVAAFGAVDLLFNNAGVGVGATIAEGSLADWTWGLGVNLWGVIHGVHFFLPIMLKQTTPCRIVNTASLAGLTTGPDLGVYTVTKHAVVSLSETLAAELAQRKANVKVSVLCPLWVNTRITDSERNRPTALANPPSGQVDHQAVQAVQQVIAQGMAPALVADYVFRAIGNDQLYILTHPETKPMIKARMEQILAA